MATIYYDDRSYLIDGKRVWLTSGSIHYFRVPHELWRDRLIKARRAGLNCIQTYVAWNFHEQQEGKWNFDDDHDVREFILQAGELGLYVILRPGPYICAEWDSGGLPAWLMAKKGIALRTSNATYMHYFDKYLGQILPRLSDLQITRGGNIILIQNENEYTYTTMPDRINYLGFINQLIRRAGFDIPIITCNYLTEPRVPDTIECCNGYEDVIPFLKRLRTAQPDAPMLATEFWPGWFDYWGGEHQVRDAKEVARKALEILGCGCQVNYYMWHGGTNFAFWASKLGHAGARWQTTSYDYDAPLAEGGGLTEKYYLTKLVNMLGTYFGKVLSSAKMVGPDVSVLDNMQVYNLSGPAGRLAVISNGGRQEITTATASLPDGKKLDVSLEPFGAVAIPVDVQLGPEALLDYANIMPLGFFGENILVLHGPAGWQARLAINGKELTYQIPSGDEPLLLEQAKQKIVIINTDLAQRTWEVDGSLIMGPDFVGESIDDVRPHPGSKHYAIITPEGRLGHKKVSRQGTHKPTPPRLGTFTRLCICDEPINEELTWERIDRPRDLAAHGINYGYGWYRLEVSFPRAVKKNIFLSRCEDRAIIYLNGKRVGIWGRGPEATREPIPVSFKRGKNVMVFLVDNLGRRNGGINLGGFKGIAGRVWNAKPLRTKKFRITAGANFSKRSIPRMLNYIIPELESEQLWTAETVFNLPTICPIHLSYDNLPHHIAIICNERQTAFFQKNEGYGDVILGNELRRGKNTLQLLIWGNLNPKDLAKINLYLLTEPISAGGKWSIRKWSIPSQRGRIVGKALPAWYCAHFNYTPGGEPLFIKIAGAKKGQIFLNGRNVGRFWNIGPQEHYYLPEPWLREDNELLIFTEQGNIPSGSELVFRPSGPYR